MLGGLLSLVSAVTFAYANASVRRGVLTGTVLQAVAISLPVALPFFAAAMLATGGFHLLAGFSWRSIGLLALAGVVHFAWARHCNYRATKAMGANLVAPIQQYSLVITLVLAVVWLGEALTPLRAIGIILVIVGPMLTHARGRAASSPAAASHEAGGGAQPFHPKYAEGYVYALMSAIGFGISPILIGMAFERRGIAVGIAGGFVSYVAATAAIALPLLLPGQWSSFKSVDGVSAKWFVISGIAVCFSQMFRYMALAIAPVSVVSPIQPALAGVSHLLRLDDQSAPRSLRRPGDLGNGGLARRGGCALGEHRHCAAIGYDAGGTCGVADLALALSNRPRQARCVSTSQTAEKGCRQRGLAGGAEGIRTPDLLIANEALSQLSYGPASGNGKWAVAAQCGEWRHLGPGSGPVKDRPARRPAGRLVRAAATR